MLAENTLCETTSGEQCLCGGRARSLRPWMPRQDLHAPSLCFGDKDLPQQQPQDLVVYSHQETMREVGAANSSGW